MSTPTTAALHEEHTCRDCGAVITLPYARPPKHIGWAAPDPAPLDVELRDAVQAHIDWLYRQPGARRFTLTDLRAAIAREYAKE